VEFGVASAVGPLGDGHLDAPATDLRHPALSHDVQGERALQS
jgi:hypothetical protein